LQGQKIWKRAGVKSQGEQDKENFDAAQKELEKEGKGSRKRMRFRGVKENIRDATWKEDLLEKSGASDDVLDNGATEPTDKESSTTVPLNDTDADALQFVPRKRTNANHVITPRKPLRQATLNGLAQTQLFTKSPHVSPQKPRRRKSMRKSIRKSVAGDIPDRPTMIIEEKSTNSISVTEVVRPEIDNKDASVSSALAAPEEPVSESTLNDKLNQLFDLTDDDIPKVKEHVSKDLLGCTLNSIEGVAKAPLNDIEDLLEEKICQSQSLELPDKENKERANIGEGQPSIGRQALDTPSAILESIERDPDTVRLAKTNTTPKRKRGASQRRGTRRSTRTTRASSVRAEEHAASEVQANVQTELPSDSAEQFEQDSVRQSTEDNVQVTPSEPAEQAENTQWRETPETGALPEQYSTIREAGESMQDTVTVTSDEADLENFDISAQLDSQLSAIDHDHHIAHDDFELPPVSASTKSVFSDSSPRKATPEVVSGVKKGSNSHIGDSSDEDSSSVRLSTTGDELNPQSCLPPNSEELNVEVLENLEPISVPADSEDLANNNGTTSPPDEDLPGSSTPDPTTSKLVETISEKAPSVSYDHDDTDMLRNFLTRVKANKAAKAGTHIPRRKRSLPHSPLRLPLGDTTNISPSPQEMKDEFDVGPPGPSPSKHQKHSDPVLLDEDDTITERKPTRRSGRTRLPVVKTPIGAPSHIPVRRLGGQDGDTTVTLKRNEEKELAALTRVNTRKNKGSSQTVSEVLAKKAEERDDPILRQRLLKEVFNEKAQKGKKERRKTVVWAEELTQYQTMEGRKLDGEKGKEKEMEKVAPAEEKKSAVKVGVRSKIALGMAVNGTPAPKRKRAQECVRLYISSNRLFQCLGRFRA
jgi:hypothetical protein